MILLVHHHYVVGEKMMILLVRDLRFVVLQNVVQKNCLHFGMSFVLRHLVILMMLDVVIVNKMKTLLVRELMFDAKNLRSDYVGFVMGSLFILC